MRRQLCGCEAPAPLSLLPPPFPRPTQPSPPSIHLPLPPLTPHPSPSLHGPQEKTTLKLDFNAEGIYGGVLIGVRSADFIVFYDWEGNIVRRIDVAVKTVHWSEVREEGGEEGGEREGSVYEAGDGDGALTLLSRHFPHNITACIHAVMPSLPFVPDGPSVRQYPIVRVPSSPGP